MNRQLLTGSWVLSLLLNYLLVYYATVFSPVNGDNSAYWDLTVPF